MSLWLLGRTSRKTEFSNSLTKFYCFNIQKGFLGTQKRSCFDTYKQYTANYALSNEFTLFLEFLFFTEM